MKRRSFDESDQIRLNLRQLDVQLNQTPPLERILTTSPILPAAVGFIVGILIIGLRPEQQTLWLALWAAVFTIAASVLILRRYFRLTALAVCCIMIFVVFGAARYWLTLATGPDHISHYFDNDRELATFRGTVISPIIHKTDDSIPWLGPKTSFYIDTEAVKGADRWHSASGKVRVQIADRTAGIQQGDEVQIHCWLSRFSPSPNPGQFDIRQYMHQRGTYVSASVPVKEGVTVLKRSHNLLHIIKTRLTGFAYTALIDETMSDRDIRALSSALLLGQRHELDPAVTAAFRKTGLAHFISLSGMHIGILAGSFWLVLRAVGLSKRPRAIVCIILIMLYAAVLPARPPTVRAVFISCFFLLSVLSRQRTSPLNTLALAALIMLLFNPAELFSVGWQLSFVSVLGILLLYEPIRDKLLSILFFPVITKVTIPTALQHFIYRMLELLAVGLSAWLTSAGILVYNFGSINLLSSVWTLLVFPFVALTLYLGFLKILIASILPTLAAIFGVLLNSTLSAFQDSVILLSKFRLVEVSVPNVSITFILAFYILLSLILFTPKLWFRTRRIIIAAALLLVFPAASCLFSKHSDLDMACLSVGHGQAVIVSAPGNHHFLFDAGSITNTDIAEKTILPFLAKKGIRHLDGVFLSHGDIDHINAAVTLAQFINIDSVYPNQAILKSAQKPSTEKQIIDGLTKAGCEICPIEPIQLPNLTVCPLWPDDDAAKMTQLSENDRSEVFLLEYAGRNILLCGDIETYAQQQLLKKYPDLKVDVLVLPHHGSAVNLASDFVQQLTPKIVIASCSQRTLNNTYHPPDDSDIQPFYTARDGAVQIKIKADGTLSVDGFLRSQD